ncbi:uncharacterized protein [Procambarus clarkii]|uniref:uncharacterized protein n=1 Tax=Procambarus clarkii TaxID=6728 RepID=UPI00374486E2
MQALVHPRCHGASTWLPLGTKQSKNGPKLSTKMLWGRSLINYRTTPTLLPTPTPSPPTPTPFPPTPTPFPPTPTPSLPTPTPSLPHTAGEERLQTPVTLRYSPSLYGWLRQANSLPAPVGTAPVPGDPDGTTDEASFRHAPPHERNLPTKKIL